jgi:hypothetical protein
MSSIRSAIESTIREGAVGVAVGLGASRHAGDDEDRLGTGLEPGNDAGAHAVDHRGGLRVRIERAQRLSGRRDWANAALEETGNMSALHLIAQLRSTSFDLLRAL